MGAGGDRGSEAGRSPERPAVRAARGLEPAGLALIVALAVSGVALVVWLSDLTFWRDEWAFLLHRRGLDAGVFLDPHYEHIAIAPVAIYKALLAVFGMDSPTPFQLAAVAMFLTSVALVFVFLRRRVGGWLALAGVLPILFLGSSWDDLLWPFQIGYFGSMAAGVGALLALEREDRAGDLCACALLALSLSFSSVGIPFAAGVAVHVLTGPGIAAQSMGGAGSDRPLRALVARLRQRGREQRLVRQPARSPEVRGRGLWLQHRLAARPGDHAGAVSDHLAQLGGAVAARRAGARRRPPATPREGAAVAAGDARDRGRLLGPRRAQHDDRTRAGRRPLSVRRCDPAAAGRGGAAARGANPASGSDRRPRGLGPRHAEQPLAARGLLERARRARRPAAGRPRRGRARP